MADSSIGALPQAPQIDDDSLLVMEQQGQAMKVTGAQFKDFGRTAVIGQVQGYVDAAEKAASEAVSAVSAVTDMTVSAHPSQEASVVKSTVDGKVHLTFGLPRGEKGDPGEQGPPGLRGPQGAPGNGLTILGHYDTEEALRAAVTSPEAGDAYSVGTELPYDTYVFDGVTLDWKNYGPFTGGGGGSVLPENVVTTPGGAALEFFNGNGPHTIEFTDEEEPPLTAEDVVYKDGTVQDALSELFTSGSEGKSLIASAVTAKGVETAADATFAELAANIGKISAGADASDATATPGDILSGRTAYTAAGKVEGIIPRLDARTYTPGTADQTIANGQYLSGTQTVKGDPSLTSSNIRKGATIFGVAGAVESSFQATLTVKADVGAVVTATNGDTEVSALSTTGTVVLELPIEGTWKVTAQRGMAQYNTVVIEVTSQYGAELTAEVHVEYFMEVLGLSANGGSSVGRMDASGASIGDYALFIGGLEASSINYNPKSSFSVDVYGKDLVRVAFSEIVSNGGTTSYSKRHSTSTEKYLFTSSYKDVDVFNPLLVRQPFDLKLPTGNNSAASIGEYAVFFTNKAYAISNSLTMTEKTEMLVIGTSAAYNGNYIIVVGGTNGNTVVYAYDKNLTRTMITSLSVTRYQPVAVRAGNYALFCGGVVSSEKFAVVDAYDLFLTRTEPEEMKNARSEFAAATLKGFAVLGGDISTVETYDPTLVRVESKDLKQGRKRLGAATVGDYVLFGGGYYDTYSLYRDVSAYRYV